jgi:hypothetical protein
MLRAAIATSSADADDERSLIALAAVGDRAASRALYDRHAARVHRLAYRVCGDPDLDEAHQHEFEPDAIDPDLRTRLAAAIEALKGLINP